jgi:hypothetical protein
VLPELGAVLARFGVEVDTCSLVYVVDWPLDPVVVTTVVMVEKLVLTAVLLDVVEVVVDTG